MIDVNELLRDVDAVLFDMDGTLIDSLWVWGEVDVEYLERYQIVEDPEVYQKAISGMSFKQVAELTKERYNLPLSVPEIMDEWNAMAEQKYRDEVPFKPGAEAFLREVKRRGIKMGIGTSNSRHLVEMISPRLELDRYIDVVITGDEVHNGKPEPDVYLRGAEELGVAPEHCLVFEDVPHGITAAHRAGMKACAVYDDNTAYCDGEKRKNSDYYIRDYNDIIGLGNTYEENTKGTIRLYRIS